MADDILSRRRAYGSGAWAALQQVVALGSAAVSGIVLARVLGVAHFGTFSYATTLAAVGSIVITAGLSGLGIKQLIDEPERQRQRMTAFIVVREGFAVVAYCVIACVALTSGDEATLAATVIASTVLFARALDVGELWFQSRAESRKPAAVRIGVVLAMLVVRLVLAANDAPLMTFILLYVAEAVAVSLALLARYLGAAESPGLGRLPRGMSRHVLATSWVLSASSVAAQVNSRGDIVIIQALLGARDVGIYAAAARLSEIGYFLPVVFMTATFPRLLHVRRVHGPRSPEYRTELQGSYDRAFWSGVGITLVLVTVGPHVLEMLYGTEYRAAGQVLRVHALALPFVFMAAVFSKWIVAENLLMASLSRHVLGAVVNIALNLLLVPRHGVIGSAWATVVSYVVASFAACFVGSSTWAAGVQMSRAMVAPLRWVGARTRRGGP